MCICWNTSASTLTFSCKSYIFDLVEQYYCISCIFSRNVWRYVIFYIDKNTCKYTYKCTYICMCNFTIFIAIIFYTPLRFKWVSGCCVCVRLKYEQSSESNRSGNKGVTANWFGIYSYYIRIYLWIYYIKYLFIKKIRNLWNIFTEY